MKISDLNGNPNNPRKITDKQLKMLKKSLTEFGDLSGIIYNTQTNRLCGGHQRIKVLPPDTEITIEMKYHSPTRTGTVADGYALIGGERFKYREVSWDEPREKAANLAANKHGGEFDMDMVDEWLKDLKAVDFDIELTGFDLPEIEVIGQCDEDSVPEQVPTVSVLGDLYELGEHRLLCSDSTSIDAVERLMNGMKADMVFTDPPYGISNDTAKGVAYSKNEAYDDSTTFDLKLLQLWDCEWVIWGGNYYDWIPEARNKTGWVVWDKRPTRETWDQETRDAADRIFGQHFEIAITNIGGIRGKMIRKTWGGFYGTAGNKDDAIVHRTQKPIELIEHFLTDKHKTILDYFGGSGSTLIACEKTKRKCFMMELDPHYVDVIVSRYCKYTGNNKIKRNGEEIEWATILQST